MLIAAYLVNVLGMIVLPIVLAFYLTRKFSLPWKLVLAGALTFIASQVLHIPAVSGLTALFNTGTLPPVPEASRAL
ncbi:MAG TPA: YhfC family glutamic-type intramembrane protease, partial [Anaerolineales bacterium]|nr:YhfC family glutamic-type intramembrane protease [Anaerolineales bacterium]